MSLENLPLLDEELNNDQPRPKFTLVHSYKYNTEWEYEETQQWAFETQNALISDLGNFSAGYKRYCPEQFAALEEYIAVNLFGISSDFADRAFRGYSLLRYFTNQQRQQARNLRIKLQKISGKDSVDIQVIPITLRMDKDLKRREGETADQRLANTNSGKVFVFRIKMTGESFKFVDCETRDYNTWEEYLQDNKLPQGIMAYPRDGLLKRRDEETGEHIPNTVEFCEPPSCKQNQAKDVLDKVIMVAAPVIAIASFWCPATWALANVLGIASYGITGYSVAIQALNCYDKLQHGEKYGAVLLTCIASIAQLVVSNLLPLHLHNVATARRALTAAENVIITGLLLGLKGAQIVSFAWMTFNIVTKPKIEPIDIIGYVVACHNLYSCIMSPKTAGQMLDAVKKQIQAENLQSAEENKIKLVKENENLAANRQKLSEANGNVKAQLEKTIKSIEDKVKQLDRDIKKNQNDYIESVKGWMTDEGAREMFQEFKENLQKNHGTKSEIEQNDCIIDVVKDIDAEKLFIAVSRNNVKIQLNNGEVLDVSNTNIQSPTSTVSSEVAQTNIATSSKSSLENVKPESKTEEVKKWLEVIALGMGIVSPIASVLYKELLKDLVTYGRSRLQEATRRANSAQSAGEASNDPAPAQARERTAASNGLSGAAGSRARRGGGALLTETNRTNIAAGTDRTLQLATKMATKYGDTSFVVIAAFTELVQMELQDFKKPDDPVKTRERIRKYHEQLQRWEVEGQIKDGVSQQNAETRAAINFQKREAIEEAKQNGADEAVINAMIASLDPALEQYQEKNFAAWNSLGTKEEIFFKVFLDSDNLEAFNTVMQRLLGEINVLQSIPANEVMKLSNPVSKYVQLKKNARIYISSLASNQDTTPVIYNDGMYAPGASGCSYDAALGRRQD